MMFAQPHRLHTVDGAILHHMCTTCNVHCNIDNRPLHWPAQTVCVLCKCLHFLLDACTLIHAVGVEGPCMWPDVSAGSLEQQQLYLTAKIMYSLELISECDSSTPRQDCLLSTDGNVAKATSIFYDCLCMGLMLAACATCVMTLDNWAGMSEPLFNGVGTNCVLGGVDQSNVNQ